MLDRAYRLSSTKELIEAECQKLKSMFSKLKFLKDLVDSIVSAFFKSKLSSEPSPPVQYEQPPIRIVLPFKNQKSADVLRKQLDSLGNKIGMSLQFVYSSRKLRDVLSVKRNKTLCGQPTRCLSIDLNVLCVIHNI